MHIEFNEVYGYATYARAQKRGNEVAELLASYMVGKLPPRFVVVPVHKVGDAAPSRFAPAFYCGDVQGGPGPFIGLTNVCCFN